jgi:beta-1,4-N-acetylglucosaminyltransferase
MAWAVLALVALVLFAAFFMIWLRRYGRGRSGANTLVVLGSGGHTGEMCVLLKALDVSYAPLAFVAASSDATSVASATASQVVPPGSIIHRIPRSREVGQTYISSVFSSARSAVAALSLVARLRPRLVLCNGPGTCLPVCAAAWLLACLGVCNTRVCFVESVCRVKTLSLTGRLLYHSRFADKVLVQWPQLLEKYPRATYVGMLM